VLNMAVSQRAQARVSSTIKGYQNEQCCCSLTCCPQPTLLVPDHVHALMPLPSQAELPVPLPSEEMKTLFPDSRFQVRHAC
jgi:hypothetical protein